MGHKVKQSLMSSRIDFFYYAFRNVLLVSVPLLVVSALILGFSMPHSSATVSGASADSLTLSLPTSCTLSSVVNSAHNATLISGTYTSDIGKTTITTLCNDGNGYAIYANGLSNRVVGNNALISSVSNNHNIETGIYQQGDTTSSWAMKLGNVSGDTSPTPPVIEQGYNNTYGLVPSTWTKVAGKTSGTTDMITGSTFTTTYAVYTAPTQHAGTYTGQVAYALIHGSGDSPTPIYLMQDVANWKDSLQLEESVQAVDIRDSKTYWVTKLKDGNIWMTQNLDLDIDSTKTYTHDDTDLGWTSENFNANAWWTPSSTVLPAHLQSAGSNNINGWFSNYKSPYQLDPNDLYFHYNERFNSLSECAAVYTTSECEHFHAGNYYNWAAAIATNNSSIYSDNYSPAPNSICPAGWRLPKGLTKNSDTIINSEFDNLLYMSGITATTTASTNTNVGYLSNGSSSINNSPLYLVRAGDIDSSLQDLNYGFYWTNTTANINHAYHLRYSSSSIYPTYIDGRNRGMSIRCIAR